MQIYGPTQVHGPQAVNTPHATRPAEAPASSSPSAMPRDQLDISSAGQHIDAVRDLPEIRSDRVQELRTAIANGAYETADKLDVALERLLDEIA